jgi:diguanylate cyclase (GGDEF)-like protein
MAAFGAIVVAIVITVGGVPGAVQRAVDDCAQAIAATSAVAACWRARQRNAGRSRWGWAILGAGLALWLSGQVYWIVIEVVLEHVVPTPSFADIGFIAAIPLQAIGLLMVSFPSSRSIERLRTALDGIVIVTSLWLVAYLLVLKQVLAESHSSRFATGVSIIYPVGDVVLITILMLALSQAGPRLRRTLIMIAVAYASVAVSDCYFAVTTVTGHYATGRIFDIGWTVGWLVLGATVATMTSDERHVGVESRSQAAVPYLMLLSSVVVAIAYFALGGRTDSTIRWTGITIIAVTMVGLLVQREHSRQAEIQRRHQSFHDSLTGLPNYLALTQATAMLLSQSTAFGLLYCDIDRLDAVNASLGRVAGDQLLHDIATRLGNALPSGCMAARCGGDEFAVLCEGATHGLLVSIAEQVMDAFEEPFSVGGHKHAVSVTIGVVARGTARHADQLLRDGLHSMQSAKSGGRGGIARVETTRVQPWTVDDLQLEDDLRAAIRGGRELVPVFQPIVRLSDRKVMGYEALVRWQHPERGLLEPGRFIELAERTGLIVPLGWWMLEAACGEFARSNVDGWVAVNVAGAQLGKGDLVPAVLAALERFDLRPWQLHLEITESQLVNPTPALLQELAALHSLGVAVALDDFGTGYSSVALLRDLNIHTIKIDLSFTRHMVTRPRDAGIVRGLVAFCRQLGIDVVAEGVESLEQAALLQEFSCPQAQGFLYGRPGPIERSFVVTPVRPASSRS